MGKTSTGAAGLGRDTPHRELSIAAASEKKVQIVLSPEGEPIRMLEEV